MKNSTRQRLFTTVAVHGLMLALSAALSGAAFADGVAKAGPPVRATQSVSVDYRALDNLTRGPSLLIPGVAPATSTPGTAPIVLRPPRGVAPTLTAPRKDNSTAIRLRPPPGVRVAAKPPAAKPVQMAKAEPPAPAIAKPAAVPAAAAPAPAKPTPAPPVQAKAPTTAPATPAPAAKPAAPVAAPAAPPAKAVVPAAPAAAPPAKVATAAPAPAPTPSAAPTASTPPAPAAATAGAPRSLLTPPTPGAKPAETKVAVVPPATAPAPKPVEPAAAAPTAPAVAPTPAPAAAAPAKPAETKVASLPLIPETLTISFAVGVPEVPNTNAGGIRSLAARLKADPALRVQLLAFASDPEESVSRSRRLSLERAVNVRKQLLDEGVDSTRIEVRALGEQSGDGAPDRVDIITSRR